MNNGPDYKSLKLQKAIMLQYLQIMIAREDWHGVADAAMDLRDMSIQETMSETRRV